MTTKETAYNTISVLVDRFEEQYSSYKNSGYNETLTRRDFIDPFFKALGWDIDNQQGFAEAYREVIHEDRVKVGDKLKAPDYSFRLSGGKRLFFVEAKKPSVLVKDEIVPAYQVRRYGWSAKLPVSIITDFEEFALYDCTTKPNPTDKASVARIKYLTFRDYLKEFDFLWDTFSKERVLKGSFDTFIKSDTHKKGTATVDKEFLQSLDNWRTYLATSISWNNKELDEDEINFVVQQTIDRIIFLRIAEDRRIEPYGNLKLSIKQGDFYKNLFDLFVRADEKYNSGLFDFKKDKLSKKLTVDNKVIKNIVSELYYPESPYEFSVLSVEILGSAYEQFLGKQIKIDKAHRAKIEEKPEVRKAGGVYYTPQYIVEYIVKNTVGKLIEGKKPTEIEKIKILDPACGSGSFLIGAYQYLLDFHKDFYSNSAKLNKNRKDSPLTPEGNLTTSEKKKILLNNIFGVDIDVNAVEVTKLSLLLKCMEGETEASIANQMKLFHERVLPTLDSNIKDGNSLVDSDFYEGKLDFGEEKKVKPFNWRRNFADTINQGGFDIVIGNPPYVRQELLGELKNYFETHYKVFHGTADLYSYFIERGIELLSDQGIFGFIIANKWMRTNYGEPLRKWLKEQSILSIVDFGDLPVFESATTYPCILFVEKENKLKNELSIVNVKSLEFESLQKYVQEHSIKIKKSSLNDTGWNLASETENNLLTKLKNNSIELGNYVKSKIYYGIKTGLNDAFIIDEETKNNLIKEDKRSAEIIKPFLSGREIKRYKIPYAKNYIILFPKGFTNEIGSKPKNPWKWLQANYSALATHLSKYEEDAKKRSDKGDFWWELRACEYYNVFEGPKIIYPNILKKPEFTFDTAGKYSNQKTFIIDSNDMYLLGYLNSKLNHFLFEKYLPKLRGGFYEPSYVFLKHFPIKQIDLKNKKEKNYHDEIVKNVVLLLKLNEESDSSKLETKSNQIATKINFYETRINQIIYELFDLTKKEIEMIENSN